MATPQTSPDADVGDGRDDQQHEEVVSSFLSGGLSGTPQKTDTNNNFCAELPAGAGAAAVDTTAKKAAPQGVMSSDANDASSGGGANVPTIASPLLGATEAADATADIMNMSDEWQLNDWPDGDAAGEEPHVGDDSRRMEHELGPQHVAMNGEANGGVMAAVEPAHAMPDTTRTAAATNLNFGIISGGGGAASASASNDRDVLGALQLPRGIS